MSEILNPGTEKEEEYLTIGVDTPCPEDGFEDFLQALLSAIESMDKNTVLRVGGE